MAIELVEAKAPAFLKGAVYGDAGSGKTYTAALVLSQFIKEYVPDSRLVMLDTEGGAGFVAPMVKKITGKELLVLTATSFPELRDFLKLCAEEQHVGLIDSATHPWRTLCEDFLDAKRERVKGAGGNPQTTRMSLNDWAPVKEVWNKGFSDPFKFLPAHLFYCGRCGDTWEMVKDDEGNETLEKTGTKMKIEKESAYEPSLLWEMFRQANPAYNPRGETTGPQWIHRAIIVKDRAGVIGGYADDPDIAFFRPHIEFLVGGTHATPTENPPHVFEQGEGPNWATIKRRRNAVLETIKDELLLAHPSTSAADKKAKVALLRMAFDQDVNWTDLEGDETKYPVHILDGGLKQLRTIIREQANG